VIVSQKPIADGLSRELIAKGKAFYLVLLNFRYEKHLAEKHSLRHELMNSLDHTLNTVHRVMILVEEDHSDLTLLDVLRGFDQVNLRLVVDLVSVFARHVECFVFANTFLLHQLLRLLASDHVT
tara:strand:+ start:650 stop:1021 length:372 start_codon:yes stop_codon:yes gene_type:complete